MRCSVWIANSVGLLNYKAFLLFLLYTFLACGVATAMLLRRCGALLQRARPGRAARGRRQVCCLPQSMYAPALHDPQRDVFLAGSVGRGQWPKVPLACVSFWLCQGGACLSNVNTIHPFLILLVQKNMLYCRDRPV